MSLLKKYWLIALSVVILIGGLMVFCNAPENICTPTITQKLITNQTSAGLYMNILRDGHCEEKLQKHDPKFLLISDLYIKAHSYALMNKLFFVLAVLISLGVVLWPALGVVFKQSIGDKAWHQSATVQTTLTALAAMMIAFYSEYKPKQTSIESLIRYVVYSSQDIETLSSKVIDELGKIDNGFSFNSTFNDKKPDETIPKPTPDSVKNY